MTKSQKIIAGLKEAIEHAKTGHGAKTTTYTLKQLREMRERGETETRKDAPEIPLEGEFWENAKVVIPDKMKPRETK
jgi:hypothetical protein